MSEMATCPRFSVIIPTKGRPGLVRAAAESVAAQTSPAYETIIVLDGDDPDTSARLQGLDARVIVQSPGGVARARNLGARSAHGDWLAFLDDDDLWHPRHLELMSSYIKANPLCRAVQAGYWTFASGAGESDLDAHDLVSCLAAIEDRPEWGALDYIDIMGRSYDLLLERNRGVISTAKVQRDVFEGSGGFPDGATCAEDWVMHLNVARLTEWHSLPDRLSFVRRHPGGNTSSNPTNGLVTLKVLHRVWADPRHGQVQHRPLVGYGHDYRMLAQDAVWGALRRHRLGLACRSFVTAAALMPRWKDRLYALTPPPVTWRVNRRRETQHAASDSS